jgi:hypothetical protein
MSAPSRLCQLRSRSACHLTPQFIVPRTVRCTQVTVAPPPVPAAFSTPPATTDWAFVPVAAQYNADMARMFDPGTYLSPRPQTCGVRIGTDGWSAWTFPLWGSPKPPQPDFANVPAITIGEGVIATPQVRCTHFHSGIGQSV